MQGDVGKLVFAVGTDKELGLTIFQKEPLSFASLHNHNPSVFFESIQLFSRKHQSQTLERISVPAGKPCFGKLVPVGIELKSTGCGQNLSPFQKDFQGFGCGHPGAELASHDGGRPPMLFEVDRGGVDEIIEMESGRSQSQKKKKSFFVIRGISPAKIVFEGHLSGDKAQKGCAHSERGGGCRGNPEFFAHAEGCLSCGKRKEVQSVDIEVHPFEKIGKIILVHPLGKDLDINLGVDFEGHFGKGVGLGFSQMGDRGADLAVEIDRFKDIEIGNMKSSDPQSGESQEMNASDAAHSGDGDSFLPEDLLLGFCDPADISGKGFFVDECCAHGIRPCFEDGPEYRRRLFC